MTVSSSKGMLASRTPDRWGRRFHRHERPHGRHRKLQKRAQRRIERSAWRADAV